MCPISNEARRLRYANDLVYAQKLRDSATKRYNENKEAIKKALREEREKNGKVVRANARANYAKHKKKIRANAQQYRIDNSERLRKRDRDYHASHIETRRQQSRESYARHQPKRLAESLAYKKNHPEKHQEANAKRRAAIAQAPINDFTEKQWKEIKLIYKNKCAYCKRKMRKLTQDHIVPLSKGGPHTASNIVPACRPCNSRKNNRPPLKPIQQLLL